ncbi:Cytochrome d ubiquinol oxidase subunit 2 [Rickettsiales bacterium Ac37b]|nr:Cytochrome d ubiquinol oxidase subunit 2 [Rickettsiales bacterium Ac37b]
MFPETMMLDYTTLRVIWWVLLGLLLIGFIIMDGFDMGVAILMPIVTKNDAEKRVLMNSIAAVWEGNQVWLITGAASIFAAWPAIYALVFSGFYYAMLLVLLALILRPVGFDFRNKIDNNTWRKIWDICIFISGFVPSLVFGVAVGNVLLGIPFMFDDNLRVIYSGKFLDLFKPFTLFCGCISLLMVIMHGAVYLVLKTEAVIADRCRKIIYITAGLLAILFICGYFWSHNLPGYILKGSYVEHGPSNPLYKMATMKTGAWSDNYMRYPIFKIVPIIGLLALALTILLVNLKREKLSFITSATALACIVATVGLSMFPFIIPSSTSPSSSLTVWDASSSRGTLYAMMLAVIFFLPIILLYTSWVYKVIRGKVLVQNQKNLY